MTFCWKGKWAKFFKTVVWTVLVTFTSQTLLLAPAQAQTYINSLPPPGTAITLSPVHMPVLMKGIKIYPDNPFRFDFFIDPGDDQVSPSEIKEESSKLIKYFLASLTVREDEAWVNLSPYEKDRITTPAFGATEMGRDLLAQDYLLKQISASMLNPDTKEGHAFWQKIYAKMREHGAIPAVSMFNKVWIVPDYAEVYIQGDRAFVVDSHLKLMLEQDYLAQSKTLATPSASEETLQVIREVILPVLEKDINEGENFVLLRQIYHAMILAVWYKRHLRQSLFSQVYVGQNKINGIDVEDKEIKEKIYQQYLAALKKGVFNFIREDLDPKTHELIPRKYYAGGITFTNFGALDGTAYRETDSPQALAKVGLQPEHFLGYSAYRVSSLVVNPQGVDWYNKLDVTALNPQPAQTVPVVKPSRLKKNLKFLMVSILALSALTFAPGIDAAQYHYDSLKGMIVKVENGDTLGHITLGLQQKQKEMGAEQPLPSHLWGPDGAVEVTAKAMGLSGPDQTIYEHQVLTMPARFFAPGIDIDQEPADTASTSIDQYASQQIAESAIPTPLNQAADDLLPTAGALPLETHQPPINPLLLTDDTPPSVQPLNLSSVPNNSVGTGLSPWVPLTLSGLLAAGLGLWRRSILSHKTVPPAAALDLEDQVSPQPETAQPSFSAIYAGELLAVHIKALSRPYAEGQDLLSARFTSLAEALSRSFAEVLEEKEAWTPQQRQDTVQLFQNRLAAGLRTAWEKVYDQPALDTLVRDTAYQLSEDWARTGETDFQDPGAVDDFLSGVLHPRIADHLRRGRAMITGASSPDQRQIARLGMLASWDQNRAMTQGQMDAESLVQQALEQTSETLSLLWKVPVPVAEATAEAEPEMQTPGEAVAWIYRHSPELRQIHARVYQQARSAITPVGEALARQLQTRFAVENKTARETVRRFFEPELSRYLMTGLYHFLDVPRIERLVNDTVASWPATSATLRPQAEAFVNGPLKQAVNQALQDAGAALQKELFSSEMMKIYEAGVQSAVDTEVAFRQGQDVPPEAVARRAAATLAQVFQDDHHLTVLPIFAQAELQKKEEEVLQAVEEDPVLPSGTETPSSRAPPVRLARLDAAVTAMAAVAMAALGQDSGVDLLPAVMASPVLFRSGMTSAYWLHEASHMAVSGPRAWTANNVRANVSWGEWIKMLVPFWGQVPGDLQVKTGTTSRSMAWVNRLFTVGVSTVVAWFAANGAAGLWQAGLFKESLAAFSVFLGSAYVWLGAVTEDIIRPLQGLAKTDEYHCGVAILIGKRKAGDKGIVPERLKKVFKNMGRTTDIRGQQAAGVKTQVQDKEGRTRWVGHRMVNAKRGDLPESLDQKFSRKTLVASQTGLSAMKDSAILIGHYRYGTSSAPQTIETHPHQWMPDRKVEVWTPSAGAFTPSERILGITIVHNGDFDDWKSGGQTYSNAQVGEWLTKVLQTENPAQGDSPKIAGMMDFLITKGIWDASARYAYYTEGVSFAEVLKGSGVLDEAGLGQLTKRFRDALVRDSQSLAQDAGQFEQSVLERLAGLDMIADWPEEQRARFVHTAVQAFLRQDEYEAVKLFLNRAVGSFGLGVGSTLKNDGVIVAADGQPLAIGLDEAREHILIASEPSALKVPLLDDERPAYRFSLRQNLGKGEIVNITDNNRITVYSREKDRELTEQEVTARLVTLQANPYISTLPDMGRDDPVGDDIGDTARVVFKIQQEWDKPDSFNRQTARNILRALLQQHIVRQIQKVSAAYAGLDASLYKEAHEVAVAHGLTWIKRVRSEVGVSRDWAEDMGMNRVMSSYSRMLEGALDLVFDRQSLDDMIQKNAESLSVAMLNGTMDEFDERAVINRFVETDLKSAVEEEMRRAKAEVERGADHWQAMIASDLVFRSRRFLSGKEEVGLAEIAWSSWQKVAAQWRALGIQSGVRPRKKSLDLLVTGIEISQWMGEQFVQDLQKVFPSLTATAESANKVLQDPGQFAIDDHTIVLALSQSGQTFPTLNAAINLESRAPDRVFAVTGEWDTLLGLAVGQDFRADAPFGGKIISNYTGFRPSEAVSLTATATHETLTELLLRLGQDMRGFFPDSRPFGMTLSREALDELAQKRQTSLKDLESITGINKGGRRIRSQEHQNLLRQGKVWADHVLDGPVSKIVTTIHLFAAVVGGFLLFPLLAETLSLASAVAAALVAQYFFFEFFQYTTTVVRRMIQGREPFARAGKRTVVIGDRSYVHQSLEMFLTKMNSLSKGGTAIDVHGGNPNDHMLHRFGHRVVRGTLIWLGIPDGRLDGKIANWQNAALMTAKQAKGVRNFGIGPEIVTVGRERAFNPNASDVDIQIRGGAGLEHPEISELYENRFDSLARLVSGQVFFHAMQKQVATLGLPPGARKFWPWNWKIHRTQSGPRIATTAAPVSGSSASGPGEKDTTLPLGMRRKTAEEQQGAVSGQDNPGGIDLNAGLLKLKERDGSGLPAPRITDFYIDPRVLKSMSADQFVPMILDVEPVPGPGIFLGVSQNPSPGWSLPAASH